MNNPRALGVTLALALAAGTISNAAQDVEGSADPSVFARYPGASIVAYSPPTTRRSYEFVTGRVDRSGRTIRVDDSIRLPARVVRVTYRAPDETRFDDVVAHYRDQVGPGAEVAFTCRARDCGRSTSWANSVFGVKELVAPDASQFYLAATIGRNKLVAIYVVQRGNRRIYAHLDVAETEEALADASEMGLAQRLRERGFAVVADVTPGLDGALDVADLRAVDAVVDQVAPLAGRTLYVVCHLAGADDPEASMTRSAACAETVVARLRSAGITALGFGGGALLPRVGAPSNRIELVMPRPAR